MYTYKRLFFNVIIAVILCSIMSIYTFEKIASNTSDPLMTYIHTKDNFDYSLSIPTYWGKVDSTAYDIVFSGNNYEYLSINFLEKEKTYSKDTYGTFVALKIHDKYNITEPQFQSIEKNGKYIYKTIFNILDNNYVAGYADCGDYIFEFEYKRTDKNDINKNLDNIISSVQRFEVKEVTLDEQVSE